MGLKLRIGLLLVLVSLSFLSVMGALHSLQPPWQRWLPDEVYEGLSRRAPKAQYYLGSGQGYVAVYQGKRDREPLGLTGIAVSGLRRADRALLEKGIPVADGAALLQLLEDLGS